jgi:hypothetical protein
MAPHSLGEREQGSEGCGSRTRRAEEVIERVVGVVAALAEAKERRRRRRSAGKAKARAGAAERRRR